MMITFLSGVSGAIASLLIAASPPQAPNPELKLPPLTGPYRLGLVRYQLTDKSRLEFFTEAPNDHRKIGLQIWYPSQANETQVPPSYLEGVDRDALIEAKVPPDIIPALRSIRTRSILNAPKLETSEKFPIVFFSPGYGGNLPRTHLTQLEELASLGYIVIGILHIDPDEKITSKAIKAALEQRVLDIQYLLDALPDLNKLKPNNPIADLMNLEQVGIWGHSMGGTTSGEMVFSDSRIDAGISLDGEFSRQVARQGLERPFMLVNQYSMSAREPTQEKVFNRSRSIMYSVSLKGAAHDAFTDIPFLASLFPQYDFSSLLSPLFPTPEEPNPRRRDPLETINQINQYSVAFFEQHLKGENSLVLKQSPSSPSIIYKFRDGSK